MLASIYNLNIQKNINRVRKNGKVYQSKNFGAVIMDRKDQSNSRFGFIVSNKISKNSTQRNRIKRALSESVRHSMNTIKNGFDVIYLTKPSIEKVNTDDIMRENNEFINKSILAK